MLDWPLVNMQKVSAWFAIVHWRQLRLVTPDCLVWSPALKCSPRHKLTLAITIVAIYHFNAGCIRLKILK